MTFRPRFALPVLVAAALWGGCANPIKPGKSPLAATQLSSDTSVFDVLFVRYPPDDEQINHQLWDEIDEQQLPAELRSRLAQNGIRAGVIGGQLPLPLSKLLDLKEKPQVAGATQVKAADLGGPARVERRHMPLRAGQPGQVVASGVYEELPVLIRGKGELCGQTYRQAQAILAVTAHPENDGRVRIDLVPEIHHDQPRQQWIGEQGVLRLDTGRPRHAFDDLAIAATLKPGDTLVLSCLPERPGSLGHHFFTEKGEQSCQKLVLIRLAQTQHNDLYNPPEPLKLE